MFLLHNNKLLSVFVIGKFEETAIWGRCFQSIEAWPSMNFGVALRLLRRGPKLNGIGKVIY